jgi:hypothetical protein
MSFDTENILRDIGDLIFDVKAAGSRSLENSRDADRVFAGLDFDDFQAVSEGLVDATQALDKAVEDFENFEERLRNIIEAIKNEELSHKVQSK